MIVQFGKRIIHRQAAMLGVVACLSIFTFGDSAQAQAGTRMQVSAEPGANGALSLTAHVSDIQGSAISEGSVSFETARGSLGSVFVRNGAASLNLANAPSWARAVTAVYHGDAAFASATASTTVTTNAAASTLPGFTVTASPSTLSLTPGQYGTVNLTVTSQNGFSEAVNLSCSGLPGASTCNFNPVVVTPPASGSAVSAMQITTTAISGAASDASVRRGKTLTYAVLIPGALVLAGLGALRRRNYAALRLLGIAMLLVAGTLGLTACNPRYSYEHYQPSPNFGTAAGNYTIVIAAYSSNGTAITQATSSDASCAGAVCLALTVQ